MPVAAVTLRRGLRVLGRGIGEEPRIFAAAIAGSVLYGAMTVAQASALGAVTSRVLIPAFEQQRTSTFALSFAALVLFGALGLKACGVYVRRVAGGAMRYRLEAGYRRRITEAYLRLPLSWHSRHSAGRLLSTANADVEATWMVIAPLPMAVGVSVMLLVAIGSMLLADPVLAIIALLLFPAILAINAVYRRKLSPLAAEVQHLRGAVSTVAHESFEGSLLVKSLGREAAETARFALQSERLRDMQTRVGRMRGLFDPVIDALPNAGALFVLLVGAARVRSGATSPAELVQVVYLFSLLAFPVRAIGWVLSELPRSVVGWERLHEVLDAPRERARGSRSLAGEQPAQLSLRHVSYSYGSAAAALTEVSFDVAAGTTTAIVGPTGSGKSTLASLLLHLLEADEGDIRVDGVPVREVSAWALAQSVAVVPQIPFVFADTVRANVSLGEEFSDEQIWEALEDAAAADFIRRLPAGLASVVGERGATLSGGQRQRLALARALVRRPRLLVLDDATSAVDTAVEATILHRLRHGRRPATLVVIAYRRATIALADQVVYLERGRLVDRGSSAELLQRCGGYRDLVTAYDRDEVERSIDHAAGES